MSVSTAFGGCSTASYCGWLKCLSCSVATVQSTARSIKLSCTLQDACWLPCRFGTGQHICQAIYLGCSMVMHCMPVFSSSLRLGCVRHSADLSHAVLHVSTVATACYTHNQNQYVTSISQSSHCVRGLINLPSWQHARVPAQSYQPSHWWVAPPNQQHKVPGSRTQFPAKTFHNHPGQLCSVITVIASVNKGE